MSHWGHLLVGLVLLGGLLLALVGLILLVARWKRGPERYVWMVLLLIGCVPLGLYLLHDPNDNPVARSWIGSYTLPCSLGGRLMLNSDSRFELSMPERAISEVGDWEYVFDGEDFIALEADGGKRIWLRVKGGNQGFEFATSKYTFDLVHCIPVREQENSY